MARAALRIQDKIEKGWRKEARKLGQLWDIERNDVIVLTNYNGIVTRTESTPLIEMDTISLNYKLRGPRKDLKIGDFLVGKELASKRQMANNLERYLLVSMRLHRDNVIVRCDQQVTIYRVSQSISGYSLPNPILGPSNQILARNTTTNVWEFRDPTDLTGYSSLVWANVAFGRAGEYPNEIRVPLTTPDEGWSVSTSYFNGVTILEGDFVRDSEDSWYRIDRAYKQNAYATINQLRCTKMKM